MFSTAAAPADVDEASTSATCTASFAAVMPLPETVGFAAAAAVAPTAAAAAAGTTATAGARPADPVKRPVEARPKVPPATGGLGVFPLGFPPPLAPPPDDSGGVDGAPPDRRPDVGGRAPRAAAARRPAVVHSNVPEPSVLIAEELPGESQSDSEGRDESSLAMLAASSATGAPPRRLPAPDRPREVMTGGGERSGGCGPGERGAGAAAGCPGETAFSRTGERELYGSWVWGSFAGVEGAEGSDRGRGASGLNTERLLSADELPWRAKLSAVTAGQQESKLCYFVKGFGIG